MEHRDSSSTPEKQLLKLIEQPGTADQHKETLKRRSIALLSPSVIKGKISFFREKAKKYLAAKKKVPLGVKGTNRILAFCTLVIAVYLAMDIVNAIRELNEALALDPTVLEVKDAYRTSSAGKLDYVEKLRLRDVFSFKSEEKPEETRVGIIPVEKTKKQMMLELLEGVDLIAVSMHPKPSALIKVKEGGARFRKEGDTINGVTIIKIFESNVLMGYKGEETFLKR